MAHQIGFEPMTLGLEGRCSIQLSYWCLFVNGVAEKASMTVYLWNFVFSFIYQNSIFALENIQERVTFFVK